MNTEITITDLLTGESIDVRDYDASLLSYSVDDGEPTVSTWRTKAMTSTGYAETTPQDATLTIELTFTGNSQKRIIDNYHAIIRHLYHSKIKFSQENDKDYFCILKKYSHAFNNLVNMTATIELSCGKYSDETTVKIVPGTENIINVGGALKTPVNIYIQTTSGTTTSLIVNVNGYTIKGKSVSKSVPNSSMEINSWDKLILVDGSELCTSPVVYFPIVLGKMTITITANDNSSVTAYATYRERWI